LYVIYTDSAGEREGLLSWDVSKDHSKPNPFILFLRVIRLIPNSSGFVSVDYHLECCIEARFWKIGRKEAWARHLIFYPRRRVKNYHKFMGWGVCAKSS